MRQRAWNYRRAMLTAWAAVVVVACLVPRVQAATTFAPKPPVMVKVEFGFDGAVPTGRWTPLRVWLSGGDKSESGMIIVEYRQDKTQSARILVPASTTPGKLSAVDFAVCLPSDPEVTVRFQSQESNESASFGSYASGDTQRIGELILGNRGLVAHVGAASIERAFSHASRVDSSLTVNKITIEPRIIDGEPRQLQIAKWKQLGSADLRPENLSPLARAYDGLDAMVVQANRLLAPDARAVAAVREWVDSGGRLVLLVPEDGAGWRAWLGTSGGEELVEIGNVADTGVSADAAAALGEKVASLSATRSTDRNNPYYQEDAKVNIDEVDSTLTARASVKARTISLTDAARRDGWKSRWGGMIAEGPVGMGWVTIIGCEPESLPATLDNLATATAWRDALRTALAPYIKRPMSDRTASETPINAALNQIVTVTEPDNTIFYAILGGLVTLMLLLGPVDLLVLKKLEARQRSWATALLWISLATIASLVIPPNLRTGRSQHNRLAVVDTLQTTNSIASQGRSWMTGITGVFGSAKFSRRPDGAVEGSWWHGVSDTGDDMYDFYPRRSRASRRGQIFAPLTTLQIASAEGGERQNVPQEFGVSLWTYRATMDEGRIRTTVRAAVEVEGDHLVVRVGPFPAGTIPTSGSVVMGGISNVIDWGLPSIVGSKLIEFRGTATLSVSNDSDGNTHVTKKARSKLGTTEGDALPGVADRSSSAQARLASSRWAAVFVIVSGPEVGGGLFSDETLAAEFERTGTVSYRILVPMAQNASADLSTEKRQ